MAAKIGILGESTATSAATVTLYTVPADKAARVQIQFQVQGGAGDSYNYAVLVGSPGTENTIHQQQVGDVDLITGYIQANTPDPAGSMLASNAGVIAESALMVDMTNVDQGQEWMVAPLPNTYHLSTGDTVRYIISAGTLGDHLIQVHGVEDDA